MTKSTADAPGTLGFTPTSDYTRSPNVVVPEPPPPELDSDGWSLTRRVGFRFAFSFFVVMTGGLAIYLVPGGAPLGRLWNRGWAATWHYVAGFVWGGARGRRGSAAEFLLVMTASVFLALASTVLWSAFDRRRNHYRRLDARFRVYLRYVLGAILLGYGIAKIIPSQFPRPTLENLYTPLGHLSRMRVLWAMMGTSTPYEIFTGIGEASGAFLLLFRRTTTLGALLVIAVMSNVVLMNFGFDVPVKIDATVYLLIAIYLVLPDVPRLARIFLFNGSAALTAPERLAWPGPARLWVGVKAVAVLWIIGSAVHETLSTYRDWHSQPLVDPMYGAWTVDAFRRNQDTLPPLETDGTRWHQVISDYWRGLSVHADDGGIERFDVDEDSALSLLTLTPQQGGHTLIVRYSRTSDSTMSLDTFDGSDSLHVQMHRESLDALPLLRLNYGWLPPQPRERRTEVGSR